MSDLAQQRRLSIREWIQQEYELSDQRKHLRPLVAVLLPVIASFIIVQMQQTQAHTGANPRGVIGFVWNSATGTASFVVSVWQFGLRIVGAFLGIGLGLGLAGHVYDLLSDARQEEDRAVGSETPGRRRERASDATSPNLPPSLPRDSTRPSPLGMEDANSYHYLMRSAGYASPALRAQMVRGPQAADARRANDAKRELMRERNDSLPSPPNDIRSQRYPRQTIYRFDKGKTASMRMKCMWPNLAPVINEALAKLSEFVLRDYVAVWYSKVDEHVVYVDPALSSAITADSSPDCASLADAESRRGSAVSSPGGTGRQGSFSRLDYVRSHSVTGGDNGTWKSPSPSLARGPQRIPPQHQQRAMVLTTTGTQPSPFMDSLYSCFSYLLGILATRAAENINVLELLLLHFPRILAHNLRIYREMRNVALKKKQRRVVAEREKWRNKHRTAGDETNSGAPLSPSLFERSEASAPPSSGQEGEVSEIAIVREYLLAGRFHRAVTFGLDVPSLLFADPLGKDTPPGPSYRGNSDTDRLNGHPDEDAVLDDRLLSPEATLIEECELDYHRVLASKLARLTVPKMETDSSIVRTMLVEMLASCVLGPVNGMFSPDTINGWLISGLGLLDVEGPSTDSVSTSDKDKDGSTVSAGDRFNSVMEGKQPAGESKRGPHAISSTCSATLGSEEEFSGIVGLDDVASVGSAEVSIISEIETSSVFDMEEESSKRKATPEQLGNRNKGEQIITMLSMSIIDLQNFVDFEDCRYAREHGEDCAIDWDAQNCRGSVINLVLVIEAALLIGIRVHPKRQLFAEDRAFSTFEIEATLDPEPDIDEFEVDIDEGLVEPKVASTICHQHSSLSATLMELTGDINAFERLVEDAEQLPGEEDPEEDKIEGQVFVPKPHELSTLRTLIVAWLHTGQACRVMSIIVRAKQTILRRYYHTYAFLRIENYANDFTKLLRQLDGVDILVDTMSVLESQCLLENNGKGDNGFDNFMKSLQRQPKARLTSKQDSTVSDPGEKPQPDSNIYSNMSSLSLVGSVKSNLAQNRDRIARFAQSASEIDLNPWKDRNPALARRPSNSSGANMAYNLYQSNPSAPPPYLAFSTNEVLASSLRSERKRRNLSWLQEIKDKKKIDFVCRTRGVRDKDIMMHRELHHLSRFFYSNTNELRIEPCSFGDDQSLPDSAANITIKAVGTRRKVEVPDDDSSFLLRANARPLKPVAIQRNNNSSCKVYEAMYEEPTIHPRTKRFYGGRYLRQCLMRYYPNDRMASVTVAKKIGVLDHRNRGDNDFVLTEDFQKLRYTCLKVATGGILSSPLMEPNDFSATPRTGRAIDFAHRISLFEQPLVELGGKKFLVRDASSHRADASSLELSDASMTAALILRGSCGLNICDTSPGNFNIQVSDDGTPLVLLRDSSTVSESKKKEARPYRPSFIRAALLLKSAKQEAQSQCLLHCIKSGSAKTLAKVKSDEWLQPTLTLLHYASSEQQDEQTAILRDLHFGTYHIDRGQLARNGLLNPRHPTILRGLNTKMLGVVAVKATSDFDLLGGPLILFRIRCTAIAEYISEDVGDGKRTVSIGDASTVDSKKDRRGSRYFREEWTVLRSLKDFSLFHKHIKSQVAPTEHSASTSAKLVGSVSAALTIVGGNTTPNQRHRGPLVPSLSQATKAGTIGVNTKKVWERRKKLLDQYLKYLVNPHNLLSRCPELLKFLGAYTHLSLPREGSNKVADEYGREDIRRVELVTEKLKAGIVEEVKQGPEDSSLSDIRTPNPVEDSMADSKALSMDDSMTVSTLGGMTVTIPEEPTPNEKKPRMRAGQIRLNDERRRLAKIRADEIRLKDVRRSIFQLLTHLFDLDNASFFRSRIISVLKTMSVAVTSVQDFNLLLVKSHVNYMNGEYISGWIFYLVDMFWPNGVFYTKDPPLTKEAQFDLKQNSKKMIQKMFPDQLRTVLGKHTDEGLDILHEMLQNRLVLKSIGYMLMDLVWSELFPELNDDYFFTGAESLGKEA